MDVTMTTEPSTEILAADSQMPTAEEKSEPKEETVEDEKEKVEENNAVVEKSAESGDSLSPAPPSPAAPANSTRSSKRTRSASSATAATTEEAAQGQGSAQDPDPDPEETLDEPRQLRKRVPKASPAPPPPTATATTPSRRSPSKTAPIATRQSTNANRKPAKSNVKGGTGGGGKASGPAKPAAQNANRGIGKSKRKARSKTNDLYDSDDFDDNHDPLPPLKHVHVARANFGDVKFTKAAGGDDSPKYINTSKSAEIRRRQSSLSNSAKRAHNKPSSPQPNSRNTPSSRSSFKKSASESTPTTTPATSANRKRPSRSSSASEDAAKKRQSAVKSPQNATNSAAKSKKRVSAIKPSISSGEMADISSYDSKATNSTMPKSTPSSGNKNSSPILSSDEKASAPKEGENGPADDEKDIKSPHRVNFEEPAENHDTDDELLVTVKDEKKSTPSTGGKRSSSGGKSTPGLFSDVEQKVCDDFDAEDFFEAPLNKAKGGASTGESKSASKSRRKRVASPQETESDFENEGENDLKVVEQGQPRPSRSKGGSAVKRQKMTPASATESEEHPASSRKKRQSNKSDAVSLTPKQKQPVLDRLSPEEQLTVDKQAQGGVHLNPGCRVLAKWKDKNFYPGNIVQNYGFGRYKVLFLDGGSRDMPAPDLVPISRLKVGDILMFATVTEDDEDELQPVCIEKTPSLDDALEWEVCVFEVQNHVKQKTEKISWEKLVIDVDQTKFYVSTLINKAAQDVVSDNISESKVRRTRGMRSTSPTTSVGSGSDKGDVPLAALASPRLRASGRTPRGSGQPASAAKPRGAARAAAASSSETAHGSDEVPKEAQKGRNQRRAPNAGAAISDTASYSSPDPLVNGKHEVEEDDQIFAGLKFVLTSANRGKVVTKEAGSSENSEDEKPLIPFNKKEVRQMIDEFGGNVLEEFALLADTSKNCFLVADQHYRTHKYLSALARAVPCVSHMWIYDSCSANKLLPYKNYVLPAGQSLETNRIVEWHDECPTLLSGLNVFVYTENRPTNPGALDFVQIWAPMVRCMGAKLLDKLPDPEDENARVDILLTDVSCPSSVLTKAAKLGADAVSSEWLIQAIIAGSRPAPNGHPKYRYDYVEQNLG